LTIYADTSFFVSAYVEDRHSNLADKFLSSNPRVFFTALHLAEWTHAIAQQVFRGEMSLAEANSVYSDLEVDLSSGLWVQMELPEGAFALCTHLARRYGPKLGVRTLDSLHVACAVELKADRFWTFDERQAKLARAEGLKTT
jgi:predicted nucleic acid-binding protein